MIPSSRTRTTILAVLAPLALIGGLALAPATATAAVVQVGSLADLEANDAIAWRQLVNNGVANAFTTPTGVVSNNGVGATVSNVSGPAHQFVASVGTTAPEGFQPNAGDPNDDLLANCCNFRPPFDYGDTTINFATPIRGFGAYVLGGSLNYTVSVLVNGALSFSVGGDYSAANRTNYPFLGVLSDALDIYSITFTSISDGGSTGVTIDNLRLNTTAAPPEPPASAAPEPATWALFIGGLGLAGGVLRRRRKTLSRFA